MEKVLGHLLIGKIGKGTVKILLIQSGILLDMVEGSGKVPLWSKSVDLVSVADCVWIRGGMDRSL